MVKQRTKKKATSTLTQKEFSPATRIEKNKFVDFWGKMEHMLLHMYVLHMYVLCTVLSVNAVGRYTWSVTLEIIEVNLPHAFFFVEKGLAADPTDAPQPSGLLCNPVMKMISFFSFFRVMEHRWNEIDRGERMYFGEKPVPLPLCPSQIPHGLMWDRSRTSGVRGRLLTA